MTNTTGHWIMHPGAYIREEMEARGWLQRDLAFVLGVPEQSVNVILAGKRGISPEMAKALGFAFDVPAEFFANLQKAFDLAQAQEPNPAVAVRAEMQSTYPVREMIKRGWIENGTPDLLKAQLVQFFEVKNPEGIPYLAHSAKKGNYEEREVPPAELAWLFKVRQIAKAGNVTAYSEKKLRQSLTRFTNLLMDPEDAREVPGILKESGVRLVLVERLPQANIDGVCFWLSDKAPVIGMSLRHDRIDNFYFVLRHEIEHVLNKDGYHSEVIDDLEGDRASSTSASIPEEERRANAAAADFCAPSLKVDSFIARKRPFFYEKDVLAFSRDLNRHPGLVVGQLQYKLNKHDYLRKYQVKIRQYVLPGALVEGWGHTVSIDGVRHR